jgi:hypothetical protein
VGLERSPGITDFPQMPGEAAARTHATGRSSSPQASTGISASSLPNTMMPTFWTANPIAEMSPIPQGPFSAGSTSFEVALAFDVSFLGAGAPACAVAAGAGWACANAHEAKHIRTAATANDRTMKYCGEGGGWPETARRMADGMLRKFETGACPGYLQPKDIRARVLQRTGSSLFHR